VNQHGFALRLKPWVYDTRASGRRPPGHAARPGETGCASTAIKALGFLAGHGCRVDLDAHRVRLPPDLVEECLHQVPPSFQVRARDPRHDLEYGGNWLHFSHTSGMQTIDLDTFEPRPPSRADFVDCARVLDALPTVSCLGCYPYFGFEGVPAVMAMPEGVALLMRHSTKHPIGRHTGCEIFNIQMAQAMARDLGALSPHRRRLPGMTMAVVVARRMVGAGFRS
jgi:trimethylamine:corrinoid methyltransferase-like protein